jgi:glycosyltransferase involved in cell wall biosynthesis
LFEELRSRGVDVACAELRGRYDLPGLRRALAAAAASGPDVVVAQQVSGQLAGALLARSSGAPLVVTEHTPCTSGGRLLPTRPHQRPLLRLAARRAARTVAVARAQVEPLARAGHARDRIRVIPNGVAPERLRPGRSRAEARAELGLGEHEFAVLAVAALRPEKRLDLLAAALSLAHVEEPGMRGFVAGEGRGRSRLERIAGDGLTLLGARDDVPDLLAAADCVCLSSDAEALPLAALEAMAAGRPVVATDVGGSSEAVANGETGLLTLPGDAEALASAFLRLARDREKAQRMGARGQERQRRLFDSETMIDAYARELEEVAGG